MPLRSVNPFQPNDRLRPSVNPFVGQFTQGIASGGIPLMGGEALKGVKGNWRKRLDALHNVASETRRPLIVEIGCHKGNILVNMASDHPGSQFIGFDITYKRVVTTAQRLKRQKCENSIAVLANGRGLNQLFEPAEVDGFVVFFPDPWPKLRHAKNRLLNENFGPILAEVLAPGGWLWFKTDSFSYFVDAEKSLVAAGFKQISDELRPALCAKKYTSTFENHFTSLHQPIADQVFLKPIL